MPQRISLSAMLQRPAPGPAVTLPPELPNRPFGTDWLGDATDVVLGGLGVNNPLAPEASRASQVGGLLSAAIPLMSLAKMGKAASAVRVPAATVARDAALPQQSLAAMNTPGIKALDMSHDARMARAAEQGFTVDAYHGTTSDIHAFDDARLGVTTAHPTAKIGHYSSSDPKDAAGWAGRGLNPLGRNVMPVKLRVNNPRDMTAQEWMAIDSDTAAEAFKAKLMEQGFDGVRIQNGQEGGQWHVALNPNQIRSRFAAFDPRKAVSKDIMAGLVGLVGAGAAGAASQRRPTSKAQPLSQMR
jgi:hypothetical protein